jgi:hypothetical protein
MGVSGGSLAKESTNGEYEREFITITITIPNPSDAVAQLVASEIDAFIAKFQAAQAGLNPDDQGALELIYSGPTP